MGKLELHRRQFEDPILVFVIVIRELRLKTCPKTLGSGIRYRHCVKPKKPVGPLKHPADSSINWRLAILHGVCHQVKYGDQHAKAIDISLISKPCRDSLGS